MHDSRIHRPISNASLFVVLNLLDYTTTHILISTDGEELMPLGIHVIENYGFPGLLAYKLALTAVVIGVSKLANFRDSLWNLLNGAFTGVVLWNTLGAFLSMFVS
jgi:hypothetical protein